MGPADPPAACIYTYFGEPTHTLGCMRIKSMAPILPLRGTGRCLCRSFCRNRPLKRPLDAFIVEWELSTPMGSRDGSIRAKWNWPWGPRFLRGFLKLLMLLKRLKKNKTWQNMMKPMGRPQKWTKMCRSTVPLTANTIGVILDYCNETQSRRHPFIPFLSRLVVFWILGVIKKGSMLL